MIMDETFNRMKETVKALGFTSNETFEDSCGLGHGFVSRITCRVKKQSLDKISRKFPQVNIGWIKSGRGEMFYRDCDRMERNDDSEDEEKGISKRALVFCKHKHISKNEFIAKTNVYNTFFTAKAKGLNNTTMMRIHTAFPDLNINWLINGVGDMIVDGNYDFDVFTNYRERLKVFVGTLGVSETFFLSKCGFTATVFSKLAKMPNEETLKKITNAYPQLNIEWLRDGSGEMLRNDIISISSRSISSIPLVPQLAYAGYLSGFSDKDYISSLPRIPFVAEDGSHYVAFEVKGDSMNDGSSRAYQEGDIVICKECPSFMVREASLNIKGREFIVVHTEGILLKSIVNIDNVNGMITLRSFNPIYTDLTLSLSEVRQVLEVEYQQRKKKR